MNHKLSYSCTPVTTSGGYPQVRVGGQVTTTVLKRPKKPRLVFGPHQIYQQVKISVQRLAADGSWKGDQRTFKTKRTTKGTRNTGTFGHGALYSPTVADGATFRIRFISRVVTHRGGALDHLHWRIQVYSVRFYCPLSQVGVPGSPAIGIPGGG